MEERMVFFRKFTGVITLKMNHPGHLLSLILKTSLFLIIVSVLLESILRLSPYNRNFVLFAESETVGLMELTAKLDHPGLVFSVPFKKEKEKGCFRVFIAGGPVEEGMPENPSVSYSHILNSFLQQSFPGKKIELIKLAPDSRNYLSQYEAIRQLKTYEADLVLLWPEWKLTSNRPSSSGLRLERFLKDLAGDSKNNQHSAPAGIQKPMEHFEKNLDKTISFLENHEIPVIVLNTCSNPDLPPLRSTFASNDSIRLQVLFEKGKTAYLSHNDDMAFSYLLAVNQKDRQHAGTCYYLGKLALRNNDPETARRFLRQAVDHDAAQQREPSAIQAIIAKQAIIHGIPLVDTDKAFQVYSGNGIPGSNFFSGPGQPNLAGNIIIARECYRAILKGNYLKENPRHGPKNLAITSFDTVYQMICSQKGLQGNPEDLMLNATGIGSFEEKLAQLFAGKKIGWEDSMNQLYAYYISNRNYARAFSIIENLAMENPYNVSLNNKASVTASFLGDSQKVVQYGKKAFAMKPDQKTAQRIFIHYLQLDCPAEALPYLEYARKYADHSLDHIYNITLQLIDLKEQLKKDSLNREIRKQIAVRYESAGNNELAGWYRNSR